MIEASDSFTPEEEAWLDSLMDWVCDRGVHIAEQQRQERESQWRKELLSEPAPEGTGAVVLALDGDEAGDAALEGAFLNLLPVSATTKNYLRSFCMRGEPYPEAIKYLSNQELFEEYQSHKRSEAAWGEVDDEIGREWYAAARESREACMLLINERATEASEHHRTSGSSVAGRFNDEHTITTVLAMFDIQAVPGRNIVCPAHDDSSPSCTVFTHDRRIYCHAAHCVLNGGGRGEDAYGLYRVLSETTN